MSKRKDFLTVNPNRHASTVEPKFTRCVNPLCRNPIWNDRYKFGGGLYCDDICESDSRRMIFKAKKEKKIKEKESKEQTIFPHNTLPIHLIIN